MIKIIAEAGSTHMGKMGYAKELIKAAKDCGADACKFQLFSPTSIHAARNIPLPYEWFGELVEIGKLLDIEVFASVFDETSKWLVVNNKCKYIKFSYSQTKGVGPDGFELAACDITCIYSGDIMNPPPTGGHSKCIKLYCIPEYPVKYRIDFENIFPRFDGFSDHTLGCDQTYMAVRMGAKVIEKHFTLTRHDIDCPDSKLALHPPQLKEMIKQIREKEEK